MAAYDTLRAAIDNYIKANGNKEITGTVLNDILNAMVSALGADTRFAGVAVPSTNPGNPEGNVVYFASQAGTYSNFGGIVLPLGIHILVWNGTAWTSQTWFSVDNTPTQNSQNLALSGGILQAIVDAVGVERLRAIGVEVTSCSFDSTTKKISFFNSANSTLFQLDATAFVIDGMVSDVKIEDGNLVIQFNTDAGKQDIEIPLTDIFNPANYYTKTAIDELLALYYTKTETDALLTAINNKLADGCLYRGMAEPTTNPPTPTTKVFYIATKAGTYTNFDNIAVTEGITILKHDGSNWSKEQICYSDGVFDISAYNGTSYAELSAALGTNGANIPENLRKGGMSVKFVQSSDNKYVQYRLMSDTFNTTPANWQGIDDEPTAGSDNLVKSGGVDLKVSSIDYVNFSNGFLKDYLWDFNKATAQLLSSSAWVTNTRLFKTNGSTIQLKRRSDNASITSLFVYFKYNNGQYETLSYEINVTSSTPPALATHVGLSVHISFGVTENNASNYEISGIDGYEKNVDFLLSTLSTQINENSSDIEILKEKESNNSANFVVGTPLFDKSSVFSGTTPYVKGEYVYVDKATFTYNAVPSGTTLLPPALFNVDENEIFIECGDNYYVDFGHYIDLYGNRLILAEDTNNYLVLCHLNSKIQFYNYSKDGTSVVHKQEGISINPVIPHNNAAIVCVGYNPDSNSVYFKTIGYDRKEHYYCEYELEEGFTKKFGIFGSNALFKIYKEASIIYKEVRALWKKKWGAIGDSETYLGTFYMRYYSLLNKFNLSTNDVKAVGGAMLSSPNDIPYFAEQLDSDCDFVTVMGGINDYALTQTNNIGTIADRPSSRSNINSVYGGVWYICKTLKERFPNKSIFFILQIPEWNPNEPGDPSTRAFTNLEDGYNTYTHKSIFDYWDAICNVCKQWSIPVIKLGANIGISFKNSSDRTKYSEDGLHPNNNGHFLEGLFIANYIENEKML